jgi:rhodanese-related sulfurtransferase
MAAAPRSPRTSGRRTKPKPKTASDLVVAAKARIENLSADEVEAEIADGAVIVDLREAEELAATGRIPGSVHIPRGMLEFRADPTSHYHLDALDPAARVILHCAAGLRSALAAATLQEMGYERVAHLEVGFGGWRDAGKPIEGGPKPAAKRAASGTRAAAASKSASAAKSAASKGAASKGAASKAAAPKAAAPKSAAVSKTAASKTAASKTAASKTAASKTEAPGKAAAAAPPAATTAPRRRKGG